MATAFALEHQYVTKHALGERLGKDCLCYPLIHFCAPTGWGKTVFIGEWLRQAGVGFTRLSFCQPQRVLEALARLAPADRARRTVVFIDDFQERFEPALLRRLAAAIDGAPAHICFILAGRAELPAELRPFAITNRLAQYTAEDLRLTAFETQQLFERSGIPLSRADLALVQLRCMGYPLALAALCERMKKAGGALTEDMLQAASLDLFAYYDEKLFYPWPPALQSFLLRIAGLEELTPELARMIGCEGNEPGELIQACLAAGGLLLEEKPGRYRVHPFITQYLLYKQPERFGRDEILRIAGCAGRYYEQIEHNPALALRYYHRAGDIERVKRLLIANAAKGVSYTNFNELEPYYLALSEAEAQSNPLLCAAMSMLHSVTLRTEESERWYALLRALRDRLPPQSKERLVAEQQLAYLAIGLPHRGARGFVTKLTAVAARFCHKDFLMQNIAITGNMPSLMHGGKDFCAWSRNAVMLRAALRAMIEALFGEAGVGLTDIGVGEAFYEQNRLEPALVELNRGVSDCSYSGSAEMRFAGTAVLARLLTAKGEYEAAMRMLQGLSDTLTEQNAQHLLPNLAAYLVRMRLIAGDADAAQLWLYHFAPDENQHFYTTERCRYMVKARAYIIFGNYVQAQLLLGRLRDYFRRYERRFDFIEAAILEAIVCFRAEDARWRALLCEALHLARRYRFIRVFADEGAAILPLLQRFKKDPPPDYSDDPAYLEQVIKATQRQALLYPDYLKAQSVRNAQLTPTELAVLRMLSTGKKYRDIEALLDISLNTVKFHIKNVYGKLQVNGKMEAVLAAKDQGIL